jgi:hypothetical protein
MTALMRAVILIYVLRLTPSGSKENAGQRPSYSLQPLSVIRPQTGDCIAGLGAMYVIILYRL